MIREKYVEERWPRYFIFGTSKDGKVDVSSTEMDIVTGVTVEEAHRLIAERDKIVDELVKVYNLLDDGVLKEHYYGIKRK